jgi:predicted phosphate transport protein (TIGR00153 family)
MALTKDELFWRSFTAMGERAVDAAQVLQTLARDPAQVETHQQRMKEIERQADDITHEVMSALHQTWITPLDREEIHELIKSLDDVVDAIDGIGERFRVYGVKKTRDEALQLTDHVLAATRAMHEALKSLQNMKNAQAILVHLKSIGTEDHHADKVLSAALKRLFEEEKDAIELIKWRDLYERLERATDRTQDVANVLEAIVLEHA